MLNLKPERTVWRISRPQLPRCSEENRWNHISAPSSRRSSTLQTSPAPRDEKTNKTLHSSLVPKPLHPFLELFSGRNCAVLKQIYFNTRHNIWTKKKKVRTFLYSFIKEQKMKKPEHWGFLLFASSAFWLLACSMYYFAIRRRRRHEI